MTEPQGKRLKETHIAGGICPPWTDMSDMDITLLILVCLRDIYPRVSELNSDFYGGNWNTLRPHCNSNFIVVCPATAESKALPCDMGIYSTRQLVD